MSDPVAIPDDLELYLGLSTGTIDQYRAELILDLAQGLCEAIVSPLPASARAVVLGVAARTYNNVTSAHQQALGSASVSFGAQGSSVGVGGLYLSRSDKATLRTLAGRGSAFSADTMPTGVNEVQTLTVTATAGTFTLAFGGVSTSALAFNATASQVQAALEALGPVGAGNVLVTGAYTVTFAGSLGTAPMPLLTVNSGSLTGTAAIARTTTGILAPGQDIPPWGFDYSRDSRFLGSQVYP